MNREKGNNNKEVIAAFDFDGTLTRYDSLPAFLLYSFGIRKWFLGFFSLLPAFFLYFVGKKSRQETKEAILQKFLRGKTREEIAILAKGFAKEKLDKIMRPCVMEKFVWHQGQGHTCVIVSAGISPYIAAWGKAKGFAKVIASELAFDEEGRCNGKLLGKNCWGEEKVVRLQETFGSKERYFLYAYGDSRGDKELLSYADEGCLL
jgi:HAD superfamily hydrolase (TIGR01490 family)